MNIWQTCLKKAHHENQTKSCISLSIQFYHLYGWVGGGGGGGGGVAYENGNGNSLS